MPPLRTTAPPLKPMRTERTHEENQERAYIAASRRGDRSLEARVESARRASEIHKRRTGRSLRVTEQDVVNEEMYEEEDDLPLGYRHLTAHLQTGSADFNRRLAAYLTNHVAMRSALDQAIHQSYAQEFPQSPQFKHSPTHNFTSPLSPTQAPTHAALADTQLSPRTPHVFRSAPYPPAPSNPGSRSVHPSSGAQPAPSASGHHRSASMNLPPATSGAAPPTLDSAAQKSDVSLGSRRMSMPTSTQHTMTSPATSLASPVGSMAPPAARTLATQAGSFSEDVTSNATTTTAHPIVPSPLTMALPLDSQQLLESALDTNDPFASMLMAGSSATAALAATATQPAETLVKPTQFDAGIPSTGIATTLGQQTIGASGSFCASDFGLTNTEASYPAMDSWSAMDLLNSQQSSNGSAGTPGADAGWDAFVNDTSWAESSGA